MWLVTKAYFPYACGRDYLSSIAKFRLDNKYSYCANVGRVKQKLSRIVFKHFFFIVQYFGNRKLCDSTEH